MIYTESQANPESFQWIEGEGEVKLEFPKVARINFKKKWYSEAIKSPFFI